LREHYLAQYAAQIQGVVQRNWIRPAGTPKGLTCSVRVEQIPGGEVVSAVVTSSCGSVALDRSVIEAVYRSSPLPKPQDPSLFDRELNFVFEPED
jgi:colicin import membrane protein